MPTDKREHRILHVVFFLLLTGLFSSCEYYSRDHFAERSTSVCAVGNTLFAGTMEAGVMMYSVPQEKWIQNTGKSDEWITCMAAAGDAVYIGQHGGGAFRSGDKGQHWDSLPIDVYFVNALITRGSSVYVAGNGGGVFCSLDDGGTWSALPYNQKTNWTYSLAATDSGLYAGTTEGVYFFRNDGYEWQHDSGVFAGNVDALVAVDNVLYAGDSNGKIYASVNNSHVWSEIGTVPGDQINQLYFCYGQLFAASDAGVFSSADNGRTWKGPLLEMRKATNQIAMSFVSVSDSFLLATQSQGVFLSVDKGKTWAPMNEGMIGERRIHWDATFVNWSRLGIFLLWAALWILPAKFLWRIQNGKRIYATNFLLGIVLTLIAMLIFCTRPSGPWDFGNLERGLVIVILYAVWGILFLIYSLVKRRKADSAV